jgi:pSer/pThr/pTyr-binding forkhead associated (FHA) protein
MEMASVQIFFDGMLEREVALQPGVTTIGRREESDIQLDDPGVSALHARIIQHGDVYYVEDAESRNGTFVNGQKIQRRRLKDGNLIAVWKHSLKFVAVSVCSGEAAAEAVVTRAGTAPATAPATVALDLSELRGMLEEHQRDAYLRSASMASVAEKSPAPEASAERTARLVIFDANMRSRTHPLSSATVTIGRTADCEVRIRGWFAPRVAAMVSRENEEFFLVPRPRGKVELNGSPLTEATRLRDGDNIRVRALMMKFYT